MTGRGFAAVGLRNPKNGENVGSTLRAAHCYGARLVVIDGPRRNHFLKHPTNTMKSHRHIPTVWTDDLFDALPFDCVPVAVDLVPGACSLFAYLHPPRALYIFGAEDATLDGAVVDRCAHRVVIPMVGCSNLAATVNVVLYDRAAKTAQRRTPDLPPWRTREIDRITNQGAYA